MALRVLLGLLAWSWVCLHLIHGDNVLHQTWSLLISAGLVSGEPQPSSCLPTPPLASQIQSHWAFHRVLRSWQQIPKLAQQCSCAMNHLSSTDYSVGEVNWEACASNLLPTEGCGWNRLWREQHTVNLGSVLAALFSICYLHCFSVTESPIIWLSPEHLPRPPLHFSSCGFQALEQLLSIVLTAASN